MDSLPSTIDQEDSFEQPSVGEEEYSCWSTCPVCRANQSESDEWAHFKAAKEVHLVANRFAEEKAGVHQLDDYIHYYMMYYRMEYERLYAVKKRDWWEVYQLILVKRWRLRDMKLCSYHSEPVYDDPPLEFNDLC